MNSPGTGPASVMPKKSLSCVLAMTSAMPLVKPMTTGRGMYRTAVPVPVSAHDDEQHAGHHRAHEQAVDAVASAMMPATTTTNAPVGPPICTYGSAERGDEEAGDDRAVDAGLRRHAGRDGERHRQRQRDQADGDAGDQVGDEGPARVVPQRETDAGSQ